MTGGRRNPSATYPCGDCGNECKEGASLAKCVVFGTTEHMFGCSITFHINELEMSEDLRRLKISKSRSTGGEKRNNAVADTLVLEHKKTI